MRAWEHKEAELEALGAELLVLSADERVLLGQKVAQHGFGSLAVAPADTEVWEAFGVVNPKRTALPHPTTLVIAGDGTTLLREVHENFRTRSDPDRALAALAGRPGAMSSATPAPIDWDAAAEVTVRRDGAEVRLVLEIAPGFHAYGAREQTGVPVYLRVDKARAAVPDGTPHTWSLGTSHVLEGRVELTLEVSAAGEVTGQAGWQLCTDSACSAPRNAPFTLGQASTVVLTPN